MSLIEEYRKQRDQRKKKIFEKANETSQGFQKTVDERFWEPTVGHDGNGYAVVRFLDAPKGEEWPFVRIWYHAFTGPSGKFYMENSLTTIGSTDPCGELNTQLWNTKLEENQNIVRDRKRKTRYISNILVVKDPGNPANEGKVFLYRYGKTLFDKINALMNPQTEYEERQNPFDLEEGRNLRIRIKNVRTGTRDFRNYDDSDWDVPSPIAKTPEEIVKIYDQCYSLNEFLDPKNFKSYTDLKARLDEVLASPGSGGGGYTPPKTNGKTATASVTPSKAEDTTLPQDDEITEEDLLARLQAITDE